MRRPLAALSLAVLPLAAQAPAGTETRERITQEARTSGAAYTKLAVLCDQAGNRLAGSPGLERAIQLTQAMLGKEGLKVWTEPVKVPHWVRGRESASILKPFPVRIGMLGLGNSVGTPKKGITAQVMVVGSFEELEQRGAEAKGKIVLFDVPFESYGKTVAYRGGGASKAAAHGAVACLVRSVGPISYDTPHTGAMNYDEKQPKIPAAAVSIESATQLHRMVARGEKVVVKLEMEARMEPDADSFNVIAELPGREKPEEIVLVSGHLDSWDVGQGAQDDGVGSVLAMEAAATLKRLGIQPRRTVRVVLYTNEENGLRGGLAYAKAHAGEAARHIAAFETDSGNGLIEGFNLDLRGEQRSRPTSTATPTDPRATQGLANLRAFAPLLATFGPLKLDFGGSGADVGPLVGLGVPGVGVGHDHSHYWDVHHTQADTLDKVDPKVLAENSARLTTLVWAVAEAPEALVPAK
ncbi:MAG TPA: M20/M25/M40 family metallo-hydrolase [Holophagaceae bacterium]|nr:M20/M25/M40 family metallo-hydrolase [Holophagaceae bacterium]